MEKGLVDAMDKIMFFLNKQGEILESFDKRLRAVEREREVTSSSEETESDEDTSWLGQRDPQP